MDADAEKQLKLDRDRLILDWMRCNEAFKTLARHYGKRGKPALVDEPPSEADPKAKPGL